MSDSRITVIVARRILSGRELEYENAMREFIAWSLTREGHEGLHVLRPGPGERDYTVISRFKNEAARRAYTGSQDYAAWMVRFAALSDGDPRIRELCGLEGFVSMPGHALRRPPTWKLAIATFFGVLPVALLLGATLTPRIATWPLLARVTLSTALMVVLLSWFVMPFVTRTLHPWLFPEPRSEETT